MSLSVQFAGCGDAFGSGGQFQTCFVARWDQGCALIDCGASSLIALKRISMDLLDVDAVVLTHLHGDHFGGLPFLLLASRFARRTAGLTIAGPPGLADRAAAALEVFYPGAAAAPLGFDVRYLEFADGTPIGLPGGAEISAHLVNHPSGAPAFAVQLRAGGRAVAYTGDTDWCDGVVAAAEGADLLIAEAYTWERPARFHMDHAALAAHRAEIGAAEVILTHMGEAMLARAAESPFRTAHDGLVVEVGIRGAQA